MGPRQRNMRTRAKSHAAPVIALSLLGFFLIAGIAFGIGMIGNVSRWLSDLPDYTDADQYLVSEPTHILDAAGNEIATFFVQNRESVTADQVSPYVLKGTVDVEDERFYEHNGVDLIGIGRAIFAQLAGRSEGASTITQQLVRNTILSEEQFDQTIERKVREAYLALKMEEIYSKDEILMMYLNTIYYGHGAYGIQAAAKTYLSKPASDLTLAEAALLVGLPNSPSYYDPTVNPDAALDRRNKVLDNMLRRGTITQEEHDAAQAEPLTLNVTETSSSGITIYSQPYFVDYVRSLLQEEFSTDVLFKGGLTVKTTIDPTVQEAAERAAIDNINQYRAADDLQIGMTVIEPSTGYIKAMVGGRDYYADDQHTNYALTGRQCGSSFKPFTLATAIKQGMNPNIIVNCNSPLIWKVNGENWEGVNFGRTSYGYISLAQATAVSSNTGYLQVAETIGNQNIVETCADLGLDTANLDASALTMTLGVGDVSMLEMAEAYATFAAGGQHRDAVAITEILSRDGKTLYKHKDEYNQALTAGEAAAVTDVLEGVMTGIGTGASGRPYIDQPVAGKTGTSGTATESNDLTFCGYTPQYAVAIWVGNPQGSLPIYGLDGSNLTLPVFRNFMQTVLADTPRAEFPTGDAPVYKNNSEWKFSKTNAQAPSKSTQESKPSEEKKEEEKPSGSDKPADTTDKPSTPEPTPDPDPSEPTDPTPDPEPGEPTNPDEGSGNETETPTQPQPQQ